MLRACVLILYTLPLFTTGLKILGLFSHLGKSHFLVVEPLLLALSEKGHDVTVISFFPQEKPPPRFKDISLKNLSMPGLELMEVDTSGSRRVKYEGVLLIKMFADLTCGPLLSSPQVQNFLKGDLSYDVILVEFFNSNCMMAIVEKVKAPTIALSSCVVMPQWNDHFGNPDNPSYIPVMFMDYSDQLSFLERVENTVMLVFNKLYFNYVMDPDTQKIVNKYVAGVSSIAEVSRNVSLLLTNSHWSLSRPKPYVPNVIEVGGMHLPQHKPLPQNIEKWINESTHGVIYFSMGSMIKGHTFPEEKRNMFLRVFKRLPQRVLWKWESDMPGKPDNIMIQRWMPQYDILCHPNVKAFISHGGMLGTTETVQCGVPALVMPQFGDQFTNAKALEASGGGLIFDFWRDDEETLYNKLKQLLEPSFQQKAKQLSARFKDRPLPPLETAIYWVEYVARHGGAHHMRTAAVGMPLYKYLLLDVIAFLLAVITAILWITYRIVKFVGRKIIGQSIKVKTN
ncbi:UDP-glucuronosyltransferase 1-8 isoform X3 [Agrilus planipennis]|uniref:UDP-glucuronosyltransferase n=1 Tax=Agrilus planipennis TaxID=224129 RepID=A0A1W4WYE4_AGRPL|nr:UDP-glucuronosyltransferase 1-8 isoform X3 [Agrilus planipennis]